MNRIGGIFGAFMGLFMVSFALEDGITEFIGGIEPGFRIRWIALLFSLFLLFLTIIALIKTGLQKRYGLTWIAVSLIVLLTALFPNLLHSFPSILGVRYGLAIAALFILFLLLLVFHFSISLSELHQNQHELHQRIMQLEQGEVAVDEQEKKGVQKVGTSRLRSVAGKLYWQNVAERLFTRPLSGTSLAAPLIIFFAVGSVFVVGLSTPQVMVGDEVTHFYMMETQSHILPQPNFLARIPTNWGTTEVRSYPHSFLWHYFGAILYRLSGGSFVVIQLYQALFLAQFLGVAYLLARSRRGIQTRSALPYLLVLATIPMTLMFSVTFYQDIPMAAQILTAFYLLRKNHWLWATLFMCLAIGIKVTAMLFFPSFFTCLLIWGIQRRALRSALAVFFCSTLLLLICTWGLGRTITLYTGAEFYPLEKIEELSKKVHGLFDNYSEKLDTVTGNTLGMQVVAADKDNAIPSEQEAAIIANHPGDLRIKENFFVYGGLLLWLMILAAGFSFLLQKFGMVCKHPVREKTWWLWGVGISYSLFVAFFLKTAPDARFFLPGLPFLLLPVAEKTVCFPRPKSVIIFLASLAVLQGGYVLAKTFRLRTVSSDVKQAISYLQTYPPVPARIFMYPEGNYRLFPVPHEWYLNYHLREFWRADNDTRITLLHDYDIGALVVKKYLVGPVDDAIINLGVYPDYFFHAIDTDPRFVKLFENAGVSIYKVPAEPAPE